MKRVIVVGIICLLVMIISLSLLIGCGNKDWFDVQYTFNKAYVKIGENWKDLEISAWTDYEGEQIQLKLPDGTVMIISSINCILYNGELPLA